MGRVKTVDVLVVVTAAEEDVLLIAVSSGTDMETHVAGVDVALKEHQRGTCNGKPARTRKRCLAVNAMGV